MEFHAKNFNELTLQELYDIMCLRVAVFVVEQNCPYQELDGADPQCLHLWLEEEGEILAYLRVVPPGVKFQEASVGRVISVRRRQGLASRMLAEGLRTAQERFGAESLRIEAQVYARQLYEKAGFVQASEEFLEDGIPHIEMLWTRPRDPIETKEKEV